MCLLYATVSTHDLMGGGGGGGGGIKGGGGGGAVLGFCYELWSFIRGSTVFLYKWCVIVHQNADVEETGLLKKIA